MRLRIEGARSISLAGDALQLMTAAGEVRVPLISIAGANPLGSAASAATVEGDEIVAPFRYTAGAVAPAALPSYLFSV